MSVFWGRLRMRKLALLVSIAAIAVAVTAQTGSAATKSHKCSAHKVSYIAHGTYVTSSPTLTKGTWGPGSLEIVLQSANHHFKKANGVTIKKSAKGTDVTFMVSKTATVTLAKGLTAVAKGDRITVLGTITERSGRCTGTFTPTVTVRKIDVLKPARK
jgi:hypothetical protein